MIVLEPHPVHHEDFVSPLSEVVGGPGAVYAAADNDVVKVQGHSAKCVFDASIDPILFVQPIFCLYF